MEPFAEFEHEGWQRVAGKYDSVWARSTRHFIPPLLPAAQIPQTMSVLDVGCGPGYVAAAAAERRATASTSFFVTSPVALITNSRFDRSASTEYIETGRLDLNHCLAFGADTGLSELRLLSPEFYRGRIRRQFSLGIAPGKGSHPGPSFCTVIGDRVEPASLVARNPNDRLLQTQFVQNARRKWLAAFSGKEAKNAIAPAMRRLERLLRMSGEMLAVFLFIARDCHLIATWQNADISKLAICSLPFLHSESLPPSWENGRTSNEKSIFFCSAEIDGIIR
jgi:hypothetical protein